MRSAECARGESVHYYTRLAHIRIEVPQLNSTQAELVQLTEKYNALLARVQRVCAAYTGPSRTALFTLANHYVLVDVPGTHPQGTPSRH